MRKQTITTSIIALTLSLLIIISGCQTSTLPNDKGTYTETTTFSPSEKITSKTFLSEAELEAFISSHQTSGYDGYYGGVMMRAISSVAPSAMMEKSMDSSESAGGSNAYSETNNQVANVDEADTIKTDGEYIYTISGNKVFIIKAYPGNESEIVSEINFNTSYPQGLFIQDDKLAVFGSLYDTTYFKEIGFTPRNGMTFFNVYDTSDKEKPSLVKDYKFEGQYFQARMTGGFIYMIATSGLGNNGGIITPMMMDGTTKIAMPVDRIHYFPIPYNYPELATIHAINFEDNSVNSESVVVEGASNMYMSEKNVYITYTEYISEWEIRQEITKEVVLGKLPDKDKQLIEKIKLVDDDVLSQAEKDSKIMQVIYDYISYLPPDEQDAINKEIEQKTVDKLKEYEYMEYTIAHKISVDKETITVGETGKVPGHAINQFSMDEDNDIFRIATTVSQRWMPIYYDKPIPVDIGGGIATEPASSDVAVASDGTAEGVAVADAKIAPEIMPRQDFTESENHVYALDKDMNVIGSLKGLAEGEQIYSTRFIGDRLYMVTFKQVDPFFVIDLSDSRDIKELGKLKIPGFSRYLHPYDENTIIGIGRDTTELGRAEGLKISLFDVTNVAEPKEIAKFVTDEKYAQSTAEYEHKAFLFDREKELLVIPAYSYTYTYDGYYGTSKEDYNGAMVFKITKDEITMRGIIDHSAGSKNYWSPMVERSLFINDLLYTKSYGLLRINNLSDLSSVNKIELKTENNPYVIY